MGSDKDQQSKGDLSPSEQAQYALKKELKSHKVEEIKWSKEPTVFDKVPAHERPFPVEPFPLERQRIPFKMTDEDRKRRQVYLESQQLTDREPVRVPELERMVYNPIRRLYRLPTDKLFAALEPVLGAHRVPFARYIVPKLFLGYLIGVVGWYNLKYNTQSWEEEKGFSVVSTRNFYLPEDAKPKAWKKWDYADRKFQARTAFRGDQYAY